MRKAQVKALHPHYDKLIRKDREKGEEFVLNLDSAQRRERRGLVEILQVLPEQDKGGGTEDKSVQPAEEDKAPAEEPAEEPAEDTEEELSGAVTTSEAVATEEDAEAEETVGAPDFEQYITHTGGGMYEVEGAEASVRGKEAALQEAKRLHG